jgi:hypothetical protein
MEVNSGLSDESALFRNIPPFHQKESHAREMTELETMFKKVKHARNEGDLS